MIALFSRQPDGKHIGMIIYLVEYFLDFFPTGNGYVSAVVQYAVYSAGRDAGHEMCIRDRSWSAYHWSLSGREI